MIYGKLKQIRELLGVSQTQASISSGIKQKDISLLETGQKKFIPSEYILFLYNLGVDLNTLFDDSLEISVYNNAHTPDTRSIKGDNSHTNIANNHTKKGGSTVSPTVSPSVSPTLKTGNISLNFGMPHVVTVNADQKNMVSLVNIKARAGYLNGYADPEYIETLPSYYLPGFEKRSMRAFEVEGNSMTPTLRNRDIVFGEWVEKLEDITDERVYVVVTKDLGIVIKRVFNRIATKGCFKAKSDTLTNQSEHQPLYIDPEDILEIWHPRIYLSREMGSPSEWLIRLSNLEANVDFLLKGIPPKQ